MDGLLTDIDVLAELVKIKMPDIYQHVTNIGLPWAVITTKWFVCLFAEVLPIESIFKVPGSLPGSTIIKLRTKISRQRAEQKENKLGR